MYILRIYGTIYCRGWISAFLAPRFYGVSKLQPLFCKTQSSCAQCAFPELKVLNGTNLLEKRLQVVLSWVWYG